MGGARSFGYHVVRILILDGVFMPHLSYVRCASWMRPIDRHGMGGARTLR